MEQKNLKYNEVWIAQRADPYVIKHENGKYYFTASLPGYEGIALREADALAGLAEAEEVIIWNKHDAGEMSEHIWAPELHYLNGKWYIYFAAGEKDDVWKIRPFVLECQGQDPIKDAWIELGIMERADEDDFSFEAFSLDATVFENKGKYYYVWAEKTGVGKQISNLYIAELEKPNRLKTVQVMLTTPDYDWERFGFWVNEAPAVIKRNGKIFLTYSASDTGVRYCMGMLTASDEDDLLDPRSWKKERQPVLCTDENKKIFGPGHNTFTLDEEGRDIVVYHARTEKDLVGNPLYVANRHAMLMKLKWDDAGSPVFTFE